MGKVWFPDRQKIIEGFRKEHGLSRFSDGRGNSLRLMFLPPWTIIPKAEDGDALIEPAIVQYDLYQTRIGEELWAYVLSGQIVIVPPFKWTGWENLRHHEF